jgi:hypothetical protein
MSLSFEAVPVMPPVDGLRKLVDSPDVQLALTKSGVKADVSRLIQEHKGDVKKALASAGINPSALASQVGLPPEAGAVFSIASSAVNVLRAKGSEGKLKAGADIAQSVINQASGVGGKIGGVATGVLTKSLKLHVHAAGKIGGATGSAVGMAILGAPGAAIGQAIGTFAGEGIRAVGKALGIKGAKEKRRDLEKKRERHDEERFAAFKKYYPEVLRQPPAALYEKFLAGQVVLSQGVEGTEKKNERVVAAVQNGEWGPLSDAALAEKWRHERTPPYVLILESNKLSGMIGERVLNYEKQLEAQQAQAQQEAQRTLAKVKQGLVIGLVDAAKKSRGAATPARQRKKAAPAAPAPPAAAQRRGYAYKRPKAAAPQAATPAQQQQISTPSYEELVRSIFGAGTP